MPNTNLFTYSPTSTSTNISTDSIDFIHVVKRQLELDIKHVLTEELVKDAVSEYEKRVRAVVKPMVERITIASLERMKDLSCLRDELLVYIKVEGGDAEQEDVSTRTML